MSFLPAEEPTVRTFKVFTCARASDPAYQIAMTETTDGTPSRCYTTYDELKDLINRIELQNAFDAGRSEGIKEVLTALGMSYREFYKIKDAKSCESLKK